MLIWRGDKRRKPKNVGEESISELGQEVIDKNVLFSCISDVCGLS